MRHAIAALILLGLMAPACAEAQPSRPVVVELFTSQGCSSCPPADALLAELAKNPDILPLAFHVTYWNNLGWHDPFSLPAATERQRAYQRLLGTDMVYTPQMIIDGQTDVIGSNRAAVARTLAAARSRNSIPLTLTQTPQGLRVEAPDGAGEARLLLIGYDSVHHTAVPRGENAGRQLSEANIVRSFTEVARWTGHTLTRLVDAPPADNAALILQAPDGRILGAAMLTKTRVSG